MPKILTDKYRNATFCLPFTADKSECAWVRPLSDTAIGDLRLKADKEAGADDTIANKVFLRFFLCESLAGWQGFYDVTGEEIPFSREAVREICECDPEFAGVLALRIRNVARMGELEERKN